MNRKSKYEYLSRNALLFSISMFGSKFLTFLLIPLYTSVLSTSEYGIADLITTSVMVLGYIFTLNIADAVLRFSIESKNSEEIVAYGFRIIAAGSIILGVLLCLFGSSNQVLWPKYCYVYMWVYFVGLQFNTVFNNYLRAVDKVKAVAISGLLTTILTLVSNIIFLLLFDLKLQGYLLSMVIGVIGTCIFQMIFIKIPLRYYLSLKCENQLKIEMLRYSFPLIFNGIAWWMNSSLDKYFITYFVGTATAGIYAVSYKIPTLLMIVQSIFNQAWNLSAIKEYDKNDDDGFFSQTYTFYNTLLVLVCSVLLVLNIPLAKFLFANEFYVARKFVPLLLISTLFSAISGFIGSIFSAVKNSKVYTVSTISAAVINTILNCLLIPKYEAFGAAVATATSFFFVWLIRLICSKKYIKWNVNFAKDLIAYFLLIVQGGLAIYDTQFIRGQIIVLCVLLALYNRQIQMLAKVIKLKLREIGKNE